MRFHPLFSEFFRHYQVKGTTPPPNTPPAASTAPAASTGGTKAPTTGSSTPPPPPPPAAPPSSGGLLSDFSEIARDLQLTSNVISSSLISDVGSRDNIQTRTEVYQTEVQKSAYRSEAEQTTSQIRQQQETTSRNMQKIFEQLTRQQVQENRKEQLRSDQSAQEKRAQEKSLLMLRSSANPSSLKEAQSRLGEKLAFKQQLPPGYDALIKQGFRGPVLFLQTPQAKPQDVIEREVQNPLAQEREGKFTKNNQGTRQAVLAAQKQLAKMMGQKDLLDQLEELEEAFVEESPSGEVENEETALAALRKALLARAFKKGDKDQKQVEDHPWQSFGQMVEKHTVLFSAADSKESAELVAQANFAGAIIMGAAIHIRLKGARLNYSGTSHHGLPIPSGDEALEMGAKELVSGFERDMGQLGVESVFVNGQRFELANPDDERKLRELVKEDPELWKMVENIREAIRETRYYRTCLGLSEESGGRA